MAHVFKDILAGWGYSSPEHHLRRVAAIENGEIVCCEYDVSQAQWRGSVSTIESFQSCSLEAEYKDFLQSLVSKVALKKLSNSSALLIHLGPVWNDVVDLKICVWQMQDCIWESPAGLGICPLEALASICGRIHEHLSRIKNPIVILHPHTCSNTGIQLGQFITAAHHIFSTGVQSVGDSLHIMSRCHIRYNALDGHSSVSLFPGQKRYCEYLSWILHHPQLVPSGDVGYCIKSVRFKKLEAFHFDTKKIVQGIPEEEPSWRPERLLMGIYCGGRQVWSGGVTPGSISDQGSELEFDTRFVVDDSFVKVRGDVVIAVWFDDHTSRWSPPRIAYPFHTSFLSFQDDDTRKKVRLFGRHLDTPDTTVSYSELAEKEGFWMDIELEKGEMVPAEQAIAQEIRQNWIQTMRATGGKLVTPDIVTGNPMDHILSELKQGVADEVDVKTEEEDLDDWSKKCQDALEDLRLHLARKPMDESDSMYGSDDTVSISHELSLSFDLDEGSEIDTPLRQIYGFHKDSETTCLDLGTSLNDASVKIDGFSPPPAPPPMPGSATKSPPPAPPPMPGSATKSPPPAPPPMPGSATKSPPPAPPPMPGSATKSPPPAPPPMPGSAAKSPPPAPPPMPGSATKSPPPAPPPMPGSAAKSPPPAPPPPPMPGSKGKSPAPPPMPSGKGKSPVHQSKTPTKDGPKFRSIFWKKNFLKDGTVWSEIHPVSGLYSVEMDVLKELFTAKEQKPRTPNTGPNKAVQTPQFQIVDDLTRANNIAIMLKSFSSFGSPSAICTAITFGDDALTEKHLEQLKQMSPRPQELEAISSFSGKVSDVHLPEQLLIELASIPRLNARLNVLLFKKQFQPLLLGARKGMDALNQSCEQLKASARLKSIFASILATGNVLNANTSRGGASAIKMDSILALADAKVVPKDIDEASASGLQVPKIKTFLEFVAWKIMCEDMYHGRLDTTSLQSAAQEGYVFQEIGILRQAVLMIESDVVQNVDALERGMKVVKEEITAEEARSKITTRQASFESHLQDAAREDSATSHDNDTSHQYLSMLREFHDSAGTQLEEMRSIAEKARVSQEDIVTWMGERGTLDAPELFKAILKFSRDFDSSFSRVFSTIGIQGVLTYVDFMRKDVV